jgi:hypothetical protein
VTQIFCEDQHSMVEAGHPEGDLWTCATGLPFLLNGRKVRSPEEFVDYKELERLLFRLLHSRSKIRASLDAFETGHSEFQHLSTVITAQIYSAWVLFAAKAFVLNRWMTITDGQRRIIIGAPGLRPVQQLNMEPGRHEHVFSSIAAAMENGPEVRKVSPIDSTLFGRIFANVPTLDRIFNIANRTPSATAFQIWRRISNNISMRNAKGTLVLIHVTEGIEESFLSLLRDGWRIVYCDAKFPSAPKGAKPATNEAPLLNELRTIWDEAIGSSLSLDMRNASWQPLANRIGDCLSQYPFFLSSAREKARQWRKNYNARKPIIVLSSGLYGAPERILDASLREVGIPVICVDHGTSKGLAVWHDDGQEDYISFSDHYGTFNLETRLLYERFSNRPQQTITEIGTPRVFTRQIAAKAQRWVARRSMGVKCSDRTLMYVTSLPVNNVPHGFGGGTDWQYSRMQRDLLSVLGEFDGRVVIKPYPVQRFADPEQIMLMPLPENVSLAPFGEFRHVRWAADLLLLDISSSTISWALATDKPLIYIDGSRAPLTSRAAEAMRESMFLFNSHEQNWCEKLGQFLERSDEAIEFEWRKKSICREEFNRRFVLGKSDGFVEGIRQILRDERDSHIPEVSSSTLQ